MIVMTDPKFGDTICKKCYEEGRISKMELSKVESEGNIVARMNCTHSEEHGKLPVETMTFDFKHLGISETEALYAYCNERGFEITSTCEFR